ncbi:MAG: CNP1-like family protein [Thauera sp.]|nr:CNP1-like family protein [Thauera sp.]
MALACFSAIGLSLPVVAGGLLVDLDPNWKEGEFALPPSPVEAGLRPFFVSSASPNRFYVDTNGVSVGSDGVVRYVLVVRTPGGAENITYEGIRCASGERRIYASGRIGGEWTPLKVSEWAPIGDNSYNRPRAALAYDYFCDGPAAPRDREHALRRLTGERDPGEPAGLRR